MTESIDEIIKRRIAGLNKSKEPDKPSEAPESIVSDNEADEGTDKGKVDEKALKGKRKRLRGYDNRPRCRRK